MKGDPRQHPQLAEEIKQALFHVERIRGHGQGLAARGSIAQEIAFEERPLKRFVKPKQKVRDLLLVGSRMEAHPLNQSSGRHAMEIKFKTFSLGGWENARRFTKKVLHRRAEIRQERTIFFP